MRTSFLLAALVAIVFSHAVTAQQLEGAWKGSISIMGQQLSIQVTFASAGDSLAATIDIPQQAAMKLPLRSVRYAHPNISFELPAGPAVASFEGTRSGDSISGRFSQAGYTGTFALAPGPLTQDEPDDTTAPPYRSEEVSFEHGSVMLAGTLTLPEGDAPHPAVVLVTGSGPQNRDEEIFGFKPFKIIADHLTRAGIAVLRYDDRGVGGSTGASVDATTADFADDALAAVALLAARPEIDPARIGIFGHSEGGIVAPIAATKSDRVAFIVLLAGPSWPGDTIIMSQVETLMRVGGADSITMAHSLTTQRMVFEALRTNTGWDDVHARMREAMRASVDSMPAEARAMITNVDSTIEARIEMQLSSTRSGWFRHFIDFDPATVLRAVRVPVLALFGEKDVQVPAKMNIQRMKEAFKKGGVRDFTIKVIPSANHLFQVAEKGTVDEYATLPKRFAPGLLETISGWILEKTKK
jgi:uncharacterized protein